MRLGIDFDNTIIAYDHVFKMVAMQQDILVDHIAPNKTALRDHIRTLPNGEITWQQIQAQVYGPQINQARMFEGFDFFIKKCRAKNICPFVVSHKTKFAAQDPTVNLRTHALAWMESHHFFDTLGFSRDHIIFESTREKKIKRLIDLNCTHIIDDLIEVLTDTHMPQSMQKIWFSQTRTSHPNIIQCPTWADITTCLLP